MRRKRIRLFGSHGILDLEFGAPGVHRSVAIDVTMCPAPCASGGGQCVKRLAADCSRSRGLLLKSFHLEGNTRRRLVDQRRPLKIGII